jgi:microcompartment protein CcmK/EutM
VKLGRIVGTVVSTAKDPGLGGFTLFLVRDLALDRDLKEGGTVVAVDAVGAGVGEVVLYCSGSSARQTEATQGRPVDAVVMAIVDAVDVAGKRLYDKASTA